MPRNVRNFWIDLNVDGNESIGTGPRRADGGFTATINVRHDGSIFRAVRIEGRAFGDGSIHLSVEPCDDAVSAGLVTLPSDADRALRVEARR